MGRKFNPVVPDYILQSIVATQSSQPPLPRKILDLAAYHVLHPESLKCNVLLPNVPEMFVDLILQEGPLDIFEREIIHPQNPKIRSQKPRILVWPQLHLE